MEIVPYFVILGIVTVAIILIMLASGWRPDVNEEKEAWKRVPGNIKGRVLVIPCFLCGLAMWAMGMNEKTAILVTICLMIFVAGAGWFWSYRKLKKEITSKKKELTSKPKDQQKQ